MFLDPQKPIATCDAESCQSCPVNETLHCHFSSRDLTRFLISVAPTGLLGGIGVYRFGAWFLLPWLIITLVYFGLIEIRVMCSHCPHYAEEGRSLKCWANYGSPKLWRYRPGPMSTIEKWIFFAGFLVILGYPLVLMIAKSQWLLLVLFSLSTIGAYLVMRRRMCSQCMNFACPLNIVDESSKLDFFSRNPVVADAWGVSEED